MNCRVRGPFHAILTGGGALSSLRWSTGDSR